MLIAMIYGGYGYGGSWIVFLIVALFVIRMVASRRSGPGPARRGPGPQGYGWGSARPTGPPPGAATELAVPADPAASSTPEASAAPASGYKIPPGWFPDPTGRFDQRYWSGTAWTEHVTKDGVPSTDAPPASLSGTG